MERKASARIVTEVQDAVAVLLFVLVLVIIISYVGDLALVMRDNSEVEGQGDLVLSSREWEESVKQSGRDDRRGMYWCMRR